jgi:hypothetical protein
MDIFKKKITTAELGVYLGEVLAGIINMPVETSEFLEYLIDKNDLDDESARFELICLASVFFDNAIIDNVKDIRLRDDLIYRFHYHLAYKIREWTGDPEGKIEIVDSRIKKYEKALETGQLASGTPAIARAFMDICIGEGEGTMDDYLYFSINTMELMKNFTELAYKWINKFKLV